jgi:3-dehydroquinate synthetase
MQHLYYLHVNIISTYSYISINTHNAFNKINIINGFLQPSGYLLKPFNLSDVENMKCSYVSLMSIDKKARGTNLRFIGLSEFGKPTVINSPSQSDLEWAFGQISGEN